MLRLGLPVAGVRRANLLEDPRRGAGLGGRPRGARLPPVRGGHAAARLASGHGPRARRRPDRRRRPLRHRRRLPPAGRLPGQDATRSSRRARRIGGTWDLFRYPGIRSDSDMYTLGYSLPAVGGRQGDRRRRRRSCDYVRDDRARPRRRRAHPLRPPRRARRVVDAPTRAGRSRPSATDTGETVRLTCGFLFACTGYYRYDEGYTPEFAGRRALRRPDRAPAALARGPRLRGQARRRDRQRRDRGDARPGDGRAGRARDDAAALADLRRLAARRATRSPTSLRRVLPAKAAYAVVRWKNVAAHDAVLPAQPARAAAGPERCIRKGVAAPAPARRRRRHALQAALQPVGPAPLPRARRRPVRGDARAGARRSSPTRSRRSPSAGCGSRSGRRARGRRRRHRDRAEPAARSAACELVVDGREVELPETVGYKGMMLSGVPEPRDRARLHERLVDAEVRPDLRVRLPAAQPHGRARLRVVHAARPDADAADAAVPRPQVRATCCARSTSSRKQGVEAPWRLHQNYARDLLLLHHGALEDGAMEFSGAPGAVPAARPPRRLKRRRGQPDRATARGVRSPRRACAADDAAPGPGVRRRAGRQRRVREVVVEVGELDQAGQAPAGPSRGRCAGRAARRTPSRRGSAARASRARSRSGRGTAAPRARRPSARARRAARRWPGLLAAPPPGRVRRGRSGARRSGCARRGARARRSLVRWWRPRRSAVRSRRRAWPARRRR